MPKNKWNISLTKGSQIAYDNIISILKTNNNIMDIESLKRLLNIKTQHICILNNSKKKNLGNFIKKNYNNGMIDLIDKYSDIGIYFKNNTVMVKYMEEEFSDWDFIDECEYS